MTISEQQLVCTRPFEWFEIHPDGSVFLCCPAWLKRPIGNLLRQSIDDIWNGPVAQEIRKSVSNGSFHNCSAKRCPHLLNRTAPVKCIDEVADDELKVAIAAKKGKVSFLPRQLNLCFDHSCNLACPSCRNKIQQASGLELQRAQRISQILQQKLIPHAHHITLSGFGDPFASPTYYNLLRTFNQRDFPELQQVRLHTNGQLLTKQMWQSLPDLPPLVSEIEISLDAATEQSYRLNRPGGDFQRLLQNLDFLKTTGCRLTLSMVVQQNNRHEISLLGNLAEKLGATLYLSKLVNWGTFSRQEYQRRAVHLSNHPEHADFVIQLQQLDKSATRFGNLSPLLKP
ncbi:4Fe-4S single cluster domain-containing protein [Malonomonas rubra DSM 5091]|uniref:4Fe-4S single cluster domain-containing protein n=1 Tax=Malonomonas rubra DSM 5091 TaxID=1122189 RepID=A0A1M6JGM4_MALRU|nr:radical SAM/SPASM domain-containing protein [Malonomonas rubra]SHJ45859.1 4Fe-4S single cluster domain-containing protein [Malonomonas rubra DSM 5091]